MSVRRRRRLRAPVALLAALCASWPAAAAALAPSPSRSAHTLRPARAGHARRCAHRRRHRHRCAVHRRSARGHAPAKPPAALAPLAPAAGAGLLQPVPAPALVPVPAPTPASAAKGHTGGEAPPSEPPSVPHVQVTAVEYAFTLSRTSVPAGKAVLELVNAGQDPHNLSFTPPEGPSEQPIATTPASQVADVTVQLQPGVYTLFCSLPTHEQKGMKATLTVE
jgi:plastocyanin